MIKLNLLPDELRKIKFETTFDPGVLRKIVLLCAGFLILVHLILVFILGVKGISLARLKRNLPAIKPKMAEIKKAKKQLSGLEANVSVIEQLIGKRIPSSKLLYNISKYLPYGMWLDNLSITEDTVNIKGKVISLKKDELSIINKFLESFKKDPEFVKYFKNIVLYSAKATTFRNREITDFILLGELK